MKDSQKLGIILIAFGFFCFIGSAVFMNFAEAYSANIHIENMLSLSMFFDFTMVIVGIGLLFTKKRQ